MTKHYVKLLSIMLSETPSYWTVRDSPVGIENKVDIGVVLGSCG